MLGPYLKENNIKQSDFARVVGVDSSYISSLVAGRRVPSLELAVRIERQTQGVVTAVSWVPDEIQTQTAGRAA